MKYEIQAGESAIPKYKTIALSLTSLNVYVTPAPGKMSKHLYIFHLCFKGEPRQVCLALEAFPFM